MERIEAEHDAVLDQLAPCRHDREIVSLDVEVGDDHTLGDPAADSESTRSTEVALDQLLEITDLEEDDPHQDQEPDDHRAVGG